MSTHTPLQINQEDVNKRLRELQELTGYDITQSHGQRIYGGPPPGWSGAPPDKGTEIYCYRIPRDCFEDELVPIFSEVGRIYELRLMIEFSGTNRSYCYVRYTNQKDAREAIRKLHNFPIRPGCLLAVTRSVDNRKLCIKVLPPLDKEVEEVVVVGELNNVVEGVANAKYRAGGWVEVEFNTHRLAALARRHLVPGNLMLFSKYNIKQVDWSDPEEYSGKVGQGKVLAVKNVPSSTTCQRVGDVFNSVSGSTVINVARERDLMLVSFSSQEGASLAMDNSSNMEIDGSSLDVSWWINKRLDSGDNSVQHKPVNIPVHQVLGPVEHLHQIAATQGWGAPHYVLSGTRYDEVTGQQIYRCTVTLPAVPHSQVHGDWVADRQLARISVANKAILATVTSSQMSHMKLLQTETQVPQLGLMNAGGRMGQVSGTYPSHLTPSLVVPGPIGISQFSGPPPFTPYRTPNHANSLYPIVNINQPPPPLGFLPTSLAQYRSPISNTISNTRPPSILLSQGDSAKPVLAVPPNHRSSIQPLSGIGHQQGGDSVSQGVGGSGNDAVEGGGGGGVRMAATGPGNDLFQYFGVDYNNNYGR